MYYSYIYLTINQYNNKIYIGKKLGLSHTSKFYLGSGKILKRKIKKYGKKFFKKIVLGELSASSLEELNKVTNEAEIEAIWLFRAYGADGENHDHIYGYNLTKGGDGSFGVKISVESSMKRQVTLRNNPSIIEEQVKKMKQTLKENPEILVKRGENISKAKQNVTVEKKNDIEKKRQKTLQSNPSIKENRIRRYRQTLKNNPKITINKEEKRKKTLRDNPEIKKKSIEKMKETLKNNPEILIKRGKNISDSKIKNKLTIGAKNPGYKKINYPFIIVNYFNCLSLKQLSTLYNQNFESVNILTVKKVLKILDFPYNSLHRLKLKEIYLKFVEENKHKIQWYIDNYERLEEKYYLNL